MPQPATADAVAIKAGTYHIENEHGTAYVTVPNNRTALEIARIFGGLLEAPAEKEMLDAA